MSIWEAFKNVYLVGGNSGVAADVKNNMNSGSNELLINLEGHLCTENSTNDLLGIDEVFTGSSWQSTLDYGIISIDISTDQDSAEDGLVVQWSPDGVSITSTDEFTILAGYKKTFTFGPASQYFRVVYTNGGVAQGQFNLTTILRRVYVKPSSHRIKDNIVADDDAELIKAVLTGEDDYGIFRNIMATQSGRLNVLSQPYTYAVAEGDLNGHFGLLKFGTRTSVTAGTSSLIWEGTNSLYTYLTTAEQLQVTSSSAQDGVGGTGIRTLIIEGLDSNFDLISETIVMNGLTQVTTINSYIRVFRAYGETSGTSYTNVGNINITNNAGTVQLLYILAGDGQTLMTMWTVPNGHTLWITNASFSTNSNKGARVSIFTRQLDGGILYPWRIRYRSFAFSGNEPFPYSVPFKVPERHDVEMRVLTPVSAGVTSCGATFEGWYEAN